MVHEYRHAGDTTQSALAILENHLNTIPGQLRAMPEHLFSKKLSPEKWSPKEIIGHLIDSATNNHHRFVRGQFEEHPQIVYDQVKWNQHNYYQVLPGEHIISLWELYNRHILEVIRHTSPELLERTCRMNDQQDYTIAWLFHDYVRHMEHHLNRVFGE